MDPQLNAELNALIGINPTLDKLAAEFQEAARALDHLDACAAAFAQLDLEDHIEECDTAFERMGKQKKD